MKRIAATTYSGHRGGANEMAERAQSLIGRAPGRPNPFHLLAIDDEPAFLDLIERWAATFPVEFHQATTAAEGLEIARAFHPGLVFLDLNLPDMDGLNVLTELLRRQPDCEVVLLTGTDSAAAAVEAIRMGASDYITKPVPMARVSDVVQQWLRRAELLERSIEIESQLSATFNFEGIVGRSPLMLELYDKMQRIAPHFANALITGETGTGKELIAQVLHKLGPRSEKPFVVCNCAAITETLFESELFGHVRGAFTGAYSNHVGLIEHANGGTLFLDEIGEVSLQAQAKLLRFLQSREVQRLGDPSVRLVDVRIVAATNRDLASLAKQGKFRPDLYYRLSMVELHTPRLSDRKEDLGALVLHFLRIYSLRYDKPGLKLSRRARGLVSRYHWPGNVRELENAIQYAAMVCRSNTIEIEDFPDSIRADSRARETTGPREAMTLEELQVKYTLEVLAKANGNRSKAADILGIGRTTLYRILERAGFEGTHDGEENGTRSASTCL